MILSQFPFKDAAHLQEGTWTTYAKGTGFNGLAPYNDTFKYEKRPPSHIYSVLLPNMSAFDAAVNRQKAATYWNWYPTSSDETQCSSAVFLALEAGGVSFGNDVNYTGGALWPNTFDKWMMDDSKNSSITGVALLP